MDAWTDRWNWYKINNLKKKKKTGIVILIGQRVKAVTKDLQQMMFSNFI